MPAVKRNQAERLVEDVANAVPVLPVLSVASFKGGVWKTSFAVSLAERLAWNKVNVLLLTCDAQMDACARLGLKRSPDLQVVSRGHGHVSVLGAAGSRLPEILYRRGLVDTAQFKLAVVDTPPVRHGGNLPGAFMVALVDGTDARANLLTMLQDTPANTTVVLVKVGGGDAGEWAVTAEALEEASGRPLLYLPDPVPASPVVKQAQDEGRSVWELARSGNVLKMLSAVDDVASMFWEHVGNGRWLKMPSSLKVVHLGGWDDGG